MMALSPIMAAGLYALHYLLWKGRPGTLGEVSEQGTLSLRVARRALARLVEGGLIRRAEGGCYAAACDPRETSLEAVYDALFESPQQRPMSEGSETEHSVNLWRSFRSALRARLSEIRVADILHGEPHPIPCLLDGRRRRP